MIELVDGFCFYSYDVTTGSILPNVKSMKFSYKEAQA